MAMSLEEFNQKLEKILKKISESIEYGDVMLATNELSKIKKLDKKSEREYYSIIAEKLNDISKAITDEIKINVGSLETSEINKLQEIRARVENTRDPFANREKVMAELERIGMTPQEQITMLKEEIAINKRDLKAIKGQLDDKSKMKVNMETSCIDDIIKNKAIIKIFDKIVSAKASYDLVATNPADAEAKENAKNTIDQYIQELQEKGVDIAGFSNWEANTNFVSDINMAKANVENDSKTKAYDYASSNISYFPDLDNGMGMIAVGKTGDEILKAVEDKYGELIVDTKKLQTKFRIKKAENKEKDARINEIEVQEQDIGMFEGREVEDVAEDALADEDIKKEAEDRVEAELGTKTKLGQKIAYYKKYENRSGFVAFFKALFSSYKNVKMLATTEESYNIAQENYEHSKTKKDEGENAFRESIRKAALKEISKGNTIDKDKLKAEAMKLAIEARVKEEPEEEPEEEIDDEERE